MGTESKVCELALGRVTSIWSDVNSPNIIYHCCNAHGMKLHFWS